MDFGVLLMWNCESCYFGNFLIFFFLYGEWNDDNDRILPREIAHLIVVLIVKNLRRVTLQVFFYGFYWGFGISIEAHGINLKSCRAGLHRGKRSLSKNFPYTRTWGQKQSHSQHRIFLWYFRICCCYFFFPYLELPFSFVPCDANQKIRIGGGRCWLDNPFLL